MRTAPDITMLPAGAARRPLVMAAAIIAAMTLLRIVYASVIELRTDEAYYWTWSQETALSFLDHPPGIAWLIRFGTAIFGDTTLGVRFGGIVAMLVTQLLLADIVRRLTHDVRAVVLAVLMPEAALYYGLLMAKVAPDVAMIPFAVAMMWCLVRLAQGGDGRWWLAAGLFAGLAMLSKFTVIMFAPAVAAFLLVPDWRWRWLRSPYPYLAVLIAIAVFSPVLIWNVQHDWAAIRFQGVRATTSYGISLRTFGDYIGLQFGLVGFVMLPVVLTGVVLTAWRGYSTREPVAILLSTAVLVPFLYFLAKSLTLRVGDTWPMFMWPVGFAAAAVNLTMLSREKWSARMIRFVAVLGQHGGGLRHRLGRHRVPLLRRRALEFTWQDRSDRCRVRLRAGRRARTGRIGRDWRDLDRHHGLPHLCHDALAVQGPGAGDRDQRARPLPGLSRSGHGPDQGPRRHLCRARAGQSLITVGEHPRQARAARSGRAPLARSRDGHVHAGKAHRLDPRAVAAERLAAVPVARAGGRV
ncbi:hypothetical protein ACVWXM_005100 [Bradyrhizobium sp. GM7.3]